MSRNGHGSVAVRKPTRMPQSTEPSPRRILIAQAIQAELPELEQLVELLAIGSRCPDPESCLSTIRVLQRRSRALAARVSSLR